MTTTAIKILLSHQPAEACWGENALLSLSDSSITLHLKPSDTLSLVQKGGRNIDKQGIRHVVLSGEHWDLEHCWAFWQGFRAPKGQQTVEWPYLSAEDKAELDRRLAIIDWVRDIINLPAEDLGPEQLAHAAVDLLTDLAPEATSYRIVKGEDLREQGYHGLHTVGRGSSRSPTLLTLDYNPTDDDNTPVFCCLVGKGITFDTGGYSLKPSGPMDSMKSDMGGAAMLTGALALAISHGLKKRIKLILCCADNMVSGNALRLGDIIRYRNGKSVEVMNTDAEGRLVLADGLIDASAYQPELLIDAATLTGAAKVALGTDYHALFSFDDDCAQQLLRSAQSEGEMFWRLPLAEFHRHRLPSYFADLNNIDSGAHTAGASSAAAFLSWFVSDYQTGWLHIDCSATYRKTAVDRWSAGATGIGVRTLANILLK